MDTAVVPWLDGVASTISSLAFLLLIVVNVAFAIAVTRTRSRALVDRWTKPVLVADVALVAALLGAPVAAAAVQLSAKTVHAVVRVPIAAISAARK